MPLVKREVNDGIFSPLVPTTIAKFAMFFPASVLDQPIFQHRSPNGEKTMAEERSLPGWPKKKLVKEV